MNTVSFYEDLKATKDVRLFMIPGMGHCAGGDGPFLFNAISTLDDWVATGRPPERIVVSNPPNAPARTRPLCPWPQEAAYTGTGSTDDEKNFRCEARKP
jgi:feruloyl esterase